MTNLAFGSYFGFSPPTYLAHVEEMGGLWIVTHFQKNSAFYIFSRLNIIAPGLFNTLFVKVLADSILIGMP